MRTRYLARFLHGLSNALLTGGFAVAAAAVYRDLFTLSVAAFLAALFAVSVLLDWTGAAITGRHRQAHR